MSSVPADRVDEFTVRLRDGTWRDLAFDHSAQRLLSEHLTAGPHAAYHGVDVSLSREQVELNARRIGGIGRAKPYPSTRFGMERSGPDIEAIDRRRRERRHP